MSTPNVDVDAIAVVGVGGLVIRTPDEVIRILDFVSVSGRIIRLALGEGLARHVADKAMDIELAEMETGETLRDLGLYQQG